MSYSTTSKAAAFSVLAAIIVFACSNSREGQRCDRNAGNNGNDDCESGLVCTKAEDLGDPTYKALGRYADRCCPVDRATATDPACMLGHGTIDSGVSSPIDGSTPLDGPSEASASDAASEASTPPDAAAEASTPADASTETSTVTDAAAD